MSAKCRFVEKLSGRALWLHCGESHFATQLIANPNSKNHSGAKRYSTVAVGLRDLRLNQHNLPLAEIALPTSIYLVDVVARAALSCARKASALKQTLRVARQPLAVRCGFARAR